MRSAGVARRGMAEAMYKTAEAITQCKFEATDPASDEVVLYKILQVRKACGPFSQEACRAHGRISMMHRP